MHNNPQPHNNKVKHAALGVWGALGPIVEEMAMASCYMCVSMQSSNIVRCCVDGIAICNWSKELSKFQENERSYMVVLYELLCVGISLYWENPHDHFGVSTLLLQHRGMCTRKVQLIIIISLC